jgi:TRAP-type C4-dicarboxylate transport system substrate-binding protein
MDRRAFIRLGAGLSARLGAGTAVAGLAGNLGTPALAQQKLALKASDVHPAGYPTVAAVESLGKKLDAATQGRLSVQMFAAMQLGGEKEAIEQAQVGAIQLARVSVGTLGPVIDELNVFNLPFLFRNTAHMQKVIDGDIGTELLDKVSNNDKAGLIGLCWMDAGARSVYTVKKPVHTIADLKGLKIRVIGNPMFVDMMNALGGNGVAMGYDQVFSAVEGRSGPGQEIRPRSAGRRARFVEQIRGGGAGKGQSRRQRDHRRCRQEAVPGRGQAGMGQIRSEILGHDQTRPGRLVVRVPFGVTRSG